MLFIGKRKQVIDKRQQVLGKRKSNRGFTLIELVMAIVVLGLAVTVFSRGMQVLSERSASPVVNLQALWVARSYLDEMLVGSRDKRLSWCDPDTYPESDSNTDRTRYRSICDYQRSEPSEVRTAIGESIVHLSDYRIRVNLMPDPSKMLEMGDSLGVAKGALSVIKAVVTVEHPTIASIQVDAWLWEYK